MATTLTWAITGHMAETVGKQCVTIVEYICSGSDDSATAKERGQIVLDRPSDDNMEDRSTFATETKLIAAVKEKLGSNEVTSIESRVNRKVQEKITPTQVWHYSSSSG